MCKVIHYTFRVIQSFRSKALKLFWMKGDESKLPQNTSDRIRRQLTALDAAAAPEQMDFPGWFFHGLNGKPKRWSVRVTANWRLTFGFEGQDAVAVDLEDYH